MVFTHHEYSTREKSPIETAAPNNPSFTADEAAPLLRHPQATTPIASDTLQRARRLLYASHFSSQFSECAWQFALILFLAAFSNYQSLILISTYGLTSGLSVCLLGAQAGRFVDGYNRLFVARCLIWSENLCVLVATGLCYLLLLWNPITNAKIVQEDPNWLQSKFAGVPLDLGSITLLIGIHFFGPLALILDKAFMVAIERDWVVILSEEATPPSSPPGRTSNRLWLSTTNVTMRQIDLSCKVLAPAIAGLVIGAWDRDETRQHYGNDLTGAALLVGVVNVASLLTEYICTARIYHMIPALAHKKSKLAPVAMGSPVAAKYGCGLWKLPQGLSTYLEQPISWAGLGLAMLYLNALTFGALMTAFLVWRGMRLETVGIWRGVSSAVGLLGTFVYRFSVQRTTIVQTGMWSILYQFLCISLTFWSLFIDDFVLSMALLIFGVCASRVGLWVFDISVAQLMQEFIPEDVRGVVGGTQHALNAFFALGSFALGFIYPDPREFHIYAAAGYSAVGLAAVLYALGVFQRASDFCHDGGQDSGNMSATRARFRRLF